MALSSELADDHWEAQLRDQSCTVLRVATPKSGMGDTLAIMYRKGSGVIQDYEKAVDWYRYSAEQGNVEAASSLALIYYEGDGVAQDYKKSVKWCRSSVEQGNATAQLNLALVYTKGRGVTQVDLYAHMWRKIAAEGGNSRAQENRDKVATRMTSSQLEEAQRLAREYVAKDYKGR